MIKKYLEGTFLEIYRGQKVWQTYRFDKCYEGDVRYYCGKSGHPKDSIEFGSKGYEEFRKEECYFLWTAFHSTNPHEDSRDINNLIPIIDISETGYHSSIMTSIPLELPERLEYMHGYMIKKLSIHNIEIMKERLPSYNSWHKNHNKVETSGQQDLLLI